MLFNCQNVGHCCPTYLLITRVGKEAYVKDTLHFTRNATKEVYDAQTGLYFQVWVRWADNKTPIIDNVYLIKPRAP